MNVTLSPPEHDEFTKRSNIFNLDTHTSTLALSYLLEYKAKSDHSFNTHLPLLINCAILAASRSQVITTMQGESVRGIGISTAQLTRNLSSSNPNRPIVKIDEFLLVLKDFITTITLKQDVVEDLRKTIDSFAFSYAFFLKYEHLFKQLGFQETTVLEDQEYLKTLRDFGWLLYISGKSKILENSTELVESIFLLTVTLGHMVSYMPTETSKPFFDHNKLARGDENSPEKDQEGIYETLYGLLKLSNVEPENVLFYQKAFQDYLSELIKPGILKSDPQCSSNRIYTAKTLSSNYNKLDAHYQRTLKHEELDERFFLTETKARTPGKFTPFARQGSINKLTVPIRSEQAPEPVKKTFPTPLPTSYRTLNYEVNDRINIKSNLSEIKFASSCIPPSPYTRLLPATPMTRAMEMLSWLNEKAISSKSELGLTAKLERLLSGFQNNFRDSLIPRLNTLVSRVLGYERKVENTPTTVLSEKKVKDKYRQATGLYLRALEGILMQDERKMADEKWAEMFTSDGFHKGLIAASAETVFFVNNTSVIKLENLLKLCEIQAFDFWKVIPTFCKFDTGLPHPVKNHLNDIEQRIVLCTAWRKDSAIHQAVQQFSELSREDDSSHRFEATSTQKDYQRGLEVPFKTKLASFQDAFFKRVLYITALHVHQLCDLLGLKEDIAERIWTVVKHILRSETDLLIQRHVDQLVLCSIYGICKVVNLPLKFQDIIAKYQQLPSTHKNDFTEIIYQVHINDTERADLIRFYNSIFIIRLKPFLFASSSTQNQPEIASATPFLRKPVFNALVLDSPLRESINQARPHPGSLGSQIHMKSPRLPLTITSPGVLMPRSAQNGQMVPGGEMQGVGSVASKRMIDFDQVQDLNEGEMLPVKKRKGSLIIDKILNNKEGNDEEFMATNSCKKGLFGDLVSPRKDWSVGFEGVNMVNRRDSADSVKSQLVIFTPKGHVRPFVLPTEEQEDEQFGQRRDGAITPRFAK